MQQQLCGECFECQSTDSLWICMICGHIGCGRYQEAHAYDHYMATNHLYALEIETQRIWDYLGDGYVHRLLQNMVDGAIVELPPNEANSSKSSLGHNHDEDETKSGDSSTKDPSIIRSTDGVMNKLENISTEYTFMLMSQMDSQRMYYEDQLDTLTKQVSNIESEIQRMTDYLNSVQQAQEHLKETDTNLEHILIENKKEKDRMDKKVAQVKERYNKVQNNLNEEKAVS
jgi:BRCA1-associated protein